MTASGTASLQGKRALVTGAASGIGWATAQRLAASGMRVIVADLDGAAAAARAAALGSAHAAIKVDISDPAQAAAMIDRCIEAFGGLDVLVNNAGRTDSSGRGLVDHDLTSLEALIGVNLTGSLAAAEAACRAMSPGGVVINLASGAAFRAIPYRGAYSASKAGVLAMTRQLAARWGKAGVRVNAVAPGFVRTELVDDLIATGRLDPAQAIAKIPLGRMAAPEEIASVIAFLASNATRMNGAIVSVDGGSHAYGGSRTFSASDVPSQPQQDPQRAVVVSSALSAPGRACASLMAGDGRRLVLIDRDREGLARLALEIGGDISIAAADPLDPAAMAKIFAGVADGTRITGVINAFDWRASDRAAGQDGYHHPALRGLFVVAREAGRAMLPNNTGALVTLLPMRQRGHAENAPDGSSLAACVMLTRTLACEWGPSGVRANTVSYGDDGAGSDHPASPEEIARIASFLLSPEASFVTGALFPADADATGGFHGER